MTLLKVGLLLIGVLVFAQLIGNGLIEGWGTSPSTLIQLAAGSGYYPFWQYGYGYRYPYYRYIYPYHGAHPTYLGNLGRVGWPKPYGFYKYY